MNMCIVYSEPDINNNNVMNWEGLSLDLKQIANAWNSRMCFQAAAKLSSIQYQLTIQYIMENIVRQKTLQSFKSLNF